MIQRCDPPTVSFAEVLFREEVRPDDIQSVEEIVRAIGVFSESEIQIAAELVEERLFKGEESGYYFTFAETDGLLIGYSCFGPIPMTANSFDLYWIAVSPDAQHRGIGRCILRDTEQRIFSMGGRRIYVEKSSRADYEPARRFYLSQGYHLATELKDYYAEGDHLNIFQKVLP